MKRPPIEGMPADQPRCQYCDQKFRCWTKDTWADGYRILARRVFAGWRSYDGLFCRLICARRFAQAAHRGGYRIVRKAS